MSTDQIQNVAGASREEVRADSRQTAGRQQADSRQTAGRQQADNRQTTGRRQADREWIDAKSKDRRQVRLPGQRGGDVVRSRRQVRYQEICLEKSAKKQCTTFNEDR